MGRRLAAALAWAQRSSDIHREHAATASLQLRTSRWRAGAGAHLQRRAFEAYEPRWVYDVRLGAGFTLGRHAVVLRATPRSFESNGARLDVALRVALHREVTLDFQHTREPGLPLRLRGALSLRAPQFVLHSGYDLATRSAAAGFEAGPTRMRVVYAVRFHPDLAWSHTWMLEFGRASEALGLH